MNRGNYWKYFVVDPLMNFEVYEFEHMFGQAHLAWWNSRNVNKELVLVTVSVKPTKFDIINFPRFWNDVDECWNTIDLKDEKWLNVVESIYKRIN